MKGKSPMMKALIGGQKNLGKNGAPELQAAIEASPAKKKNPGENLLKAVPNKEAYDKLSEENKKGFDKAAKKAGLPTKKSPVAGKKRKLKKLDKKIKKRQTKEIKENLSKLSTEELMKKRDANSPVKNYKKGYYGA
jgi:TRAP-type mannitol/chloroaromatic compound transport system substrate-binding protein